jgi:hypothetical protein
LFLDWTTIGHGSLETEFCERAVFDFSANLAGWQFFWLG